MKHLLAIIAFIITTFAVQGLSHFVINKDHFASIEFMRDSPIMPLGFAVMVIQGLILSLALSTTSPGTVTVSSAYKRVFAFGLFLGSYIVLTEPAKYAAPSLPAWMMVEGTASFVQFALFGVVLWGIHAGHDRWHKRP
ncbi:MAG: hypothetical protein AAGA03_07560 [Planctomycetota bacterium]